MAQNYRVVSEIRRHGDWVDIPDRADNVTVQPLGADGRVRVSYLMPTQSVEFESDDESCVYVD